MKKRASIAKAEAERDVSCAKAAAAMAANEKEIEAQTAIAKRNNELELAKSQLKAEADKAAADAQAAGMIQTNLRAREVKESEADAEIAKQKKMVDLAAQEAEVQQRKLDAEVRKQADAELYRRQKEAEAQKYEAERAAEAAKFAKQQEAEGIALVGRAEAEAIRQKGLAEAEAMKQKAEAYKQYNDAAVAEMMIKVLPDIAKSVAQPLSAIDKVSIIGGDAGGVSGISGNVPVLMAQTIEAMKEATGIDMKEIVRANSIQAKTDRNINVTGLDSLKPESPENPESPEIKETNHRSDGRISHEPARFNPGRLFLFALEVYPLSCADCTKKDYFPVKGDETFFQFMPKNMHFVQNVCRFQKSMVCYTHIKERTTPAGMLFKPCQRRRNPNVGDHPPDCGASGPRLCD